MWRMTIPNATIYANAGMIAQFPTQFTLVVQMVKGKYRKLIP
jgi:hypothetical protein